MIMPNERVNRGLLLFHNSLSGELVMKHELPRSNESNVDCRLW